ncbi:hypothetical protein V5O48_012580 [Marasmius crinis-equi]|uniref:Uncharacterized protein n=1 Tax=Marasmius crinis-equi TaxID=585013 RepID=A0ABR3F2E8_9AGAR
MDLFDKIFPRDDSAFYVDSTPSDSPLQIPVRLFSASLKPLTRQGAFQALWPDGSIKVPPPPILIDPQYRLALGIKPETRESLAKATSDPSILSKSSFKELLSSQLLCCFLAPDITAYVRDIKKPLLRLIRDNPSDFGLTLNLEDRKFMKKLQVVVSHLSSEILEEMRRKIQDSFRTGETELPFSEPLSIYDLCTELASTDRQPSCDIKFKSPHWARVAFLRHCFVEFGAKNSPATAAATTFWNFVDDQLVQLRAEALCRGRTLIRQGEILSRYFQYVLEQDLENYPSDQLPPRDDTLAVNPWHQRVARAMVF